MLNSFILLPVTDLELLVSQGVKIIVFIILVLGIGWNLYKLLKVENTFKKKLSVVFICLFICSSVFLYKWIKIEGSILSSNKYTIGTTIGICQVLAKGKAIEFEYELANTTYRNCNTYHPVPIEKILIPGGKYYVRYSEQYPEYGRIDFNRFVDH